MTYLNKTVMFDTCGSRHILSVATISLIPLLHELINKSSIS